MPETPPLFDGGQSGLEQPTREKQHQQPGEWLGRTPPNNIELVQLRLAHNENPLINDEAQEPIQPEAQQYECTGYPRHPTRANRQGRIYRLPPKPNRRPDNKNPTIGIIYPRDKTGQ